MEKLSVQEYEEIGKALGKVIKEKYSGSLTEEQIKKMIDDGVRDTIRKSAGRDLPFASPMAPTDVITLSKALEEPAGKDETIKKFQDFNDDLYTLTRILKVHPTQLSSYPTFEKRWTELKKALNTATAGSGLDWIPTGYSSQMIEAVELAAVVASKFYSFTMPTNPYVFPIKLSDGTGYLGGEATVDSPTMYKASTMQTSNLSFTAKKLIANYPVTEEMTEDSIVPVLPTLRNSISKAIAKAEENAIINGDTTATHFDTGDIVASDDARRAWKGLRRLCSDANGTLAMKQDGATWSTSAGLALLRAIVEDMGKYGLNPADLMIILNSNMKNKFKGLAEVSTVDKFGSAATVTNGVLTAIDGIEFVLSQYISESLNNSGIYDGSTLTDTQYLVVYKPGFWRGIRRDIKLDYVEKPMYGMNYLVASTRRVWQPIYDSTTEPMIGWQYNVTK